MEPSKRIKVLYTIPNFDTAGSGKVVYDLVKGLDKTKFEVEIACMHNQGDFFKTVEGLGCTIHLFNTKTQYRPYHTLLLRLKPITKFYKDNNYDIIHSWQWSNDWTEALAARLAGVKWMYTKKAMGFNKHWKIKSYLANFIITINDEMRAYFPNKKSQKLIPLGIDTSYYSPETFGKVNSNYFEIITVANLVPVKGIEILIRAVKHLNDKAIRVTILGDNSNTYGRDMQSLCEALNISDQVIFLGKKADIRPYVAKSDVYVIPTLDQGRKEGMPMALVEAMSMAIPVLGSNITGIKYVLKDFENLRFEPGNYKALALKLSAIQHMDTKSQHRLGEELRQYCQQHFSMSRFIESHEQLYTNLVQ